MLCHLQALGNEPLCRQRVDKMLLHNDPGGQRLRAVRGENRYPRLNDRWSAIQFNVTKCTVTPASRSPRPGRAGGCAGRDTWAAARVTFSSRPLKGWMKAGVRMRMKPGEDHQVDLPPGDFGSQGGVECLAAGKVAMVDAAGGNAGAVRQL